jgi:UDP-N-acetylmuramoyl-tripeptide--D-alanyl-D-alanine ligase
VSAPTKKRNMNLTIQDLLTISHKNEQGISKLSPKIKFRNVSTDSRSIKSGDLFIALRGEKFDGHDFIEQVAKQGAIAAIVDEKWYKKNSKKIKLPLLIVKDTLESYGELAHLYRKKFSIPILLIAGSNGKTTTKEVISHVLGTSFNVLRTQANYNNQVGLPRMLFQLTPKHDIAVLEIGTNHPGEIAWLAKTAAPTHGLITNIGKEHLEFFKDIAGVAKEELALNDYLNKKNGFVFINDDDPFLRKEKKRFSGRTITYGSTKTDVSGKGAGYSSDGKLKVLVAIGRKEIAVKSNLIANYAPSLFAAATAVASYFNMPPEKIKKALESFKPFSKRMEIEKIRGIIIINDTYNANPESFVSALDTLKQIPAKGKKYVIAGDMFELGKSSKKEHHRLGALMANYKFNGGYFLTGKEMEWAFQSIVRKNVDLNSCYEYQDEIAPYLNRYLKSGDVVLVKGSRGMEMESVIEQIRIKDFGYWLQFMKK